MKNILLALTFATAAFHLHAEGTIAFGNSVISKVLIIEPDNTSRPATAGDNLLIGVFYGPPQSDADSLLPAPGFATIGPVPGLLTNAPNIFPLPGTAPNSFVSLQFRAWDAALGPDGWQSVRFQYGSTFKDYCGAGGRYYGYSPVLQITLGLSNGPAAWIWQSETGLNPTRFNPLHIQDVCTNPPPSVSITWPPKGYFPFGVGTQIKIKASAADLDGSIASVSFYAETNFIGTVTNPPYEIIWPVEQYCDFRCPVSFRYNLIAVAQDNRGAQTESKPVRIGVSETRPASASFEIISPANGSTFPEPGSFTFSAEMLAGAVASEVEFFVGTNSLGIVHSGPFTIATPPLSVTVTNLAEGEYDLTIRGFNDCQNCIFLSNTIRVVKLGITSPRRNYFGYAEFDVVTSFPGRKTIIEASPNLYDWMPLATNIPVSTSFIFTDTSFVSRSNGFYRARVPLD